MQLKIFSLLIIVEYQGVYTFSLVATFARNIICNQLPVNFYFFDTRVNYNSSVHSWMLWLSHTIIKYRTAYFRATFQGFWKIWLIYVSVFLTVNYWAGVRKAQESKRHATIQLCSCLAQRLGKKLTSLNLIFFISKMRLLLLTFIELLWELN